MLHRHASTLNDNDAYLNTNNAGVPPISLSMDGKNTSVLNINLTLANLGLNCIKHVSLYINNIAELKNDEILLIIKVVQCGDRF